MKLLVVAWAVAVLPLEAAPIYSVTNLGGLGGSRSEGLGLNGSGAAAGVARTAAGYVLPVVFGSGGTSVLAGGIGQANAVNSAGTAVGTLYTADGARAAVWSGGAPALLPTVGGAESYGLAINDLGDVVGSAGGRAFLYSDGSVRDLGTLGGSWSSAYAVNGARQAAGYSSTAAGSFGAFLYDPAGGMQALGGLPGGGSSYAFALNDSGVAVGSAVDPAGYLRAVMYASGTVIGLGGLGGNLSAAYGINSAGEIVGYAYDALGRSRAFVWIGGFLYDLNAVTQGAGDWTFEAAYSINNAGQIAGAGTYRGQAAAFLLNPLTTLEDPASAVPEPGTAALTMAALAIAFAVRQRKHT